MKCAVVVKGWAYGVLGVKGKVYGSQGIKR